MSESLPGTRVIAISHMDDEALYIYGYGVYEGDFIPPYINLDAEVEIYKAVYESAREENPGLPEKFDEAEFRRAVEAEVANPRIRLDSGKTVWGYECWWSEIDQETTEALREKKIIELDIEAERRKFVN